MAQRVKAPAAKPDYKAWSQDPKWWKNRPDFHNKSSALYSHVSHKFLPPLLYINEYIRIKMIQYWDGPKANV